MEKVLMRDTKETGGKERRCHKRFRVKEGALAFLGTMPGSIIDISEGGLTIHYAVFETEPKHSLRLDIFFAENDFYLPDLPGQLVNDKNSLSDGTFSSVRVKRLGIQFGELSIKQKDQLQYFILHNTIAEA